MKRRPRMLEPERRQLRELVAFARSTFGARSSSPASVLVPAPLFMKLVDRYARDDARNRSEYLRRRRAGLCARRNCPNRARPNKILCEVCAADDRIKHRARKGAV